MTSTERGSYNQRGSYKCDGIPMDPPIVTAARALAAGDPLAEAEIALVSRDLGWPAKALDTARATLEAHADLPNAAHARYLESSACC